MRHCGVMRPRIAVVLRAVPGLRPGVHVELGVCAIRDSRTTQPHTPAGGCAREGGGGPSVDSPAQTCERVHWMAPGDRTAGEAAAGRKVAAGAVDRTRYRPFLCTTRWLAVGGALKLPEARKKNLKGPATWSK